MAVLKLRKGHRKVTVGQNPVTPDPDIVESRAIAYFNQKHHVSIPCKRTFYSIFIRKKVMSEKLIFWSSAT